MPTAGNQVFARSSAGHAPPNDADADEKARKSETSELALQALTAGCVLDAEENAVVLLVDVSHHDAFSDPGVEE
jgi:hypothetical protein